MKRFWNSTAGLLLYILIVVGLAFLISKFCIGRVVVDGPSMKNTLQDQESVIVNKIKTRFMQLDRFDIVVFKYEYEVDTRYIKRVIGLPGETIQIDNDGNIFINGELLQEDYGREIIEDPGMAIDPITIGEDEYFVLGDNRNNSNDSRDPDVGLVKKEQLYGVAWLRVYPFKKFGLI